MDDLGARVIAASVLPIGAQTLIQVRLVVVGRRRRRRRRPASLMSIHPRRSLIFLPNDNIANDDGRR